MHQPGVSVDEVYGSPNVKRMMQLFGYNDQTQMQSKSNQPLTLTARPVVIFDRSTTEVDWTDFRNPIYKLDIGDKIE